MNKKKKKKKRERGQDAAAAVRVFYGGERKTKNASESLFTLKIPILACVKVFSL